MKRLDDWRWVRALLDLSRCLEGESEAEKHSEMKVKVILVISFT